MTGPQLARRNIPSAADILALSHIYNGISSACAVAIGFLVTAWYNNQPVNAAALLYAFLATLCISNAGFIINDILDLPIDRINRPDRPLAAGKIPVSLAWAMYGIYNVVGILLGFAVSPLAGVLVTLNAAALFLYSYILKKKFLLGHLTIAALGATMLPFGGVAAGALMPTLYTVPVIFAAFFAREVLKTVPDVEGDRANGVDNVATRFGPLTAMRLAQIVLAVVTAALPLIQLVWTLSPWFIIIVAVVIWPLTIFTLLRALKPDEQRVKTMLRLSKMLFLLVAVAFLVGSIH